VAEGCDVCDPCDCLVHHHRGGRQQIADSRQVDSRHADKQTSRQADKQTSRQADKQTSRQANKQTSRQTNLCDPRDCLVHHNRGGVVQERSDHLTTV
jgi:hypothetical protein